MKNLLRRFTYVSLFLSLSLSHVSYLRVYISSVGYKERR